MATHDPAVPGIAPDLVRDAQLQTEFLSEGRIRQTTRESASNEETDSAQRVQVWKRAQTIGRGAFDTTWLETCVEGTCKGQVRAVKVFQGISPDLALSGLEKAFKFSQDRYSQYFVRILGWYSGDGASICVPMEYSPYGSLDMLCDRALPEHDTRTITSQVVKGLEFLHRELFAHGDLKPTNILLVRPGPDWSVKIGGLEQALEHNSTQTLMRGTSHFLAPEIVFSDPSEMGRSKLPQDLWSLGVIVFLLLSQKYPFPAPSALQQVVSGTAEPRLRASFLEGHNVSDECLNFVIRLLSYPPSARLTAHEASSHMWLASPSELSIEALKETNHGLGAERESLRHRNTRFHDRVIEYEEKFEAGNHDIARIKTDIKHTNDEIKRLLAKFHTESSATENLERALKQLRSEKEVVEVAAVRLKAKMAARDGLLNALPESPMRPVRPASAVSYNSTASLRKRLRRSLKIGEDKPPDNDAQDSEKTQNEMTKEYRELGRDNKAAPVVPSPSLSTTNSQKDTPIQLDFSIITLPIFVISLLDIWNLALQPSAPAQYTRITWRCECGSWIFDDVLEIEAGAAEAMRLAHGQSHIGTSRKQGNELSRIKRALKALSGTLTLTVQLLQKAFTKKSKPTTQHGSQLPTHESTTESIGMVPSCPRNIWLLLCIKKGPSSTLLHQELLLNISTDRDVFDFLRVKYYEHRKYPSWFTLRCVKSVSLTKFNIDASYYAAITSHNSHCVQQQDCTCLPPLTRVLEFKEYSCSPAPERPPSTIPALPPGRLTHYFLKPHASLANGQKAILLQLPKRIDGGELQAPLEGFEDGWGLYFEEDWHWPSIVFVCAISVLGSLIFGIAWSAKTGDIQSGFTVSAVIIATLSVPLALVVMQDSV